MWTQIRLLLQEQSDLGLHCLFERLLTHFGRRQRQTNIVVIGDLRVKSNHVLFGCIDPENYNNNNR